MDVGHIVAVVDLIVGICVLGFGISAYIRLRGGTLAWVALMLSITGIFYASHAGVEVFGFGEELYAVTAMLAILVWGFTLIICDVTIRLLGVKS